MNEDVLLADIAGDLVGVQHPMYPRFEKAFCEKDKNFLCRFTYDDNPKSHAYIPKGWGKVAPDYSYANWYYLQSAVWGGKASFVKWAMTIMAEEVEIDISKNVMSKAIQDERYVNHFFWAQRNNASINMRILHYSYLYPGPRGAKGHGDWLHKRARPIMIHIDKSMGHLPVGELEIESVSAKGQCMDPYLPKGQVGIFGCHHLGDTQAWFWTKEKPFMKSDTKQKCMDTTGLKPGDAVILSKCDASVLGQHWDYTDEQQIRDKSSSLCLDLQGVKVILVQECSSSKTSQKWKMIEREGA